MFQRRNIIFSKVVVGFMLITPLPGFCQKYNALNWSLVSSDLYTSRITVKHGSKAIISYDLNCDVSEALTERPNGIPDYERNQVDIIKTHSHPNGLLAVICHVERIPNK